MTFPLRSSARGVAAAFGVVALAGLAQAGPVIKLTLDDLGSGGTNPDVGWRRGVLLTLDDGVAATSGTQNTAIDFVGALGGMTDISAGGSFSLTGVFANGAPSSFAGMIVQPTQGGTISLYDDFNTLLLSADIHDGALSGSSTGTAGSFFSIDSMQITGGTLASQFLPSPAAISIAMVDVNTGGLMGMRIVGSVLDDFNATAVVDIDATVPAPASALALGGLLGVAGRRRRA